MDLLTTIISSVARLINRDWEATLPDEPQPHSVHLTPAGVVVFEFWEEPSEEGKSFVEKSGATYSVTKKVAKLVLKPVT